MEKVKFLLDEAKFTSLTTHTWTPRAVKNYMIVTAHYIDKEWTNKSVV